MASVEKGVRQALTDGVIAGFPAQDIRVIVYDGKTHAVDGKDIAFVTAGRKATVEAIRAANPIVLEPIVSIEIVAPEAAIGDLTGDLSSRRAPDHRHQPPFRRHRGDYRRGAAGRDHRLRLAPEIADGRAGHLQTSSSPDMRQCRRRCSRKWLPRTGRRKRKIERDVIWLESVALRPSSFD
jgi:hypothetical protein